MKTGKVVYKEKLDRGLTTGWTVGPIFKVTDKNFKNQVMKGNVILVAGVPEIVGDGIFNKATNKFKFNLKQTATQAAITAAEFAFLAKMKFNFAPTALTADTKYYIFGSALYLIKLSADSKYYLAFDDGTTVAKKELSTWTAGTEFTAIFAAWDNEGTPNFGVGLADAEYDVTFGTAATYDTTPSTIAFTTAGTTTEAFASNALNICLQNFSLFDHVPGANGIKLAIEG